MISPESHLDVPGKLTLPNLLPGLNVGGATHNDGNPFSGIKRAGQAKRAQNFMKFQNGERGTAPGQDSAGFRPNNASFDGSKYQNLGGVKNTQVGSMRQMKFA